MAGRPVRRHRRRELEKIGEDHVFGLYLEVGTVRALLHALGIPAGSWQTLYDFLRESQVPEHERTGRWERWQQVLEVRGELYRDEVAELADEVTEDNYQSHRVKINAKQWLHERMVPSKRQLQAVVVGTPQQWLEAMRQGFEPPTVE